MKITPTAAYENIIKIFKAKLVPFLHGSPSTAKSSIVKQLATKYNLKLIDIRLSQVDPLDLNGLVSVNKDRTRGEYLPMGLFPLEGDPIPEGYDGFLLFLDEMNTAPPSIQAASYRIMLDREIGQAKLHDNCFVAAAGNLDSDKAITFKMSSALKSRLIHLEIELDFDNWLKWAVDNNIDYRVLAYLNFKPNGLNGFNPDSPDLTYACGRTWEFVSLLIKDEKKVSPTDIALISGAVGEGSAREFIAFCSVFKDLPTIETIKRDPENVYIENEPSVSYALASLIANHIDVDNAEPLVKFISRLSIEFQIMCMQQSIPNNPKIASLACMNDWFKKYGQELFD